MIIVPLSHAWQGQSGVDIPRGGSPNGMTLLTNSDGSRMPTDLEGATFQGRRLAKITNKLHGGASV
jgi:NAD(P)H dehydrogenase (quinone)